ncbi:MAG: PEP-CTERM sorting domain-containing protein [Verrucomicrobia bacterium]|nr:PEP-CTERM sorting domain-containing protein [Verrucomicrobiota bacterium]
MKPLPHSLALATVASAATIQASIFVLDHFDSPVGGQAAIIVNGTSITPPVTSTAVGLGLGALGDTRAITLDIDSVRAVGNASFPNTGSSERGSANLTPDNLALEAGAHASTTLTVSYDNGSAGLGLDLSTSTAIQFMAAANDQGTWWTLTLSDGLNTHTEAVFQVAGFAGDFQIALAPFMGAGVDLSNVWSLAIVIDPQEFGGDAILHALVAIPEPNAAWLLLGLGGLGVLWRRVRSPMGSVPET